MKKIMFSDEFLLTQAVLDGRKTQTRRIINLTLHEKSEKNLKEVLPEEIFLYEGAWLFKYNCKIYDMPRESRPKYEVGEVVAVAQAYNDFYNESYNPTLFPDGAGWINKMFVKPELMPHRVKITGVRIERLQDISDDDCLKEGIEWDGFARSFYCAFNKSTKSKIWLGHTPREAYTVLIDRIIGKGTWGKNPYVFVYDFELVK